MNREYENLTGIELIKGFCSEVLAYGLRLDLDITGVKIWLPPKLKDALELGESLAVDCQGHTFNVPIIIGKTKEIPLGGGKFQTDIFVGDPEWEIDLTKGEIGFEKADENTVAGNKIIAGIRQKIQDKIIKHFEETKDQVWCKCDSCTLIRLEAEDKKIIRSLAYAGLEYLLGENFNAAAALSYYSHFKETEDES